PQSSQFRHFAQIRFCRLYGHRVVQDPPRTSTATATTAAPPRRPGLLDKAPLPAMLLSALFAAVPILNALNGAQTGNNGLDNREVRHAAQLLLHGHSPYDSRRF